ncbi:MAG: hypothetical protein RL492_69 [Verrucomicrobiota bacterium]|jgi:hypothetical protein
MAPFRTILAWLACATCAMAADLTPTEVIAKARAALTKDTAALAKVRSLQFELTSVNAEGKPTGYTLLEVNAPDQRYQLSVNAARTIEETMATNGREGWRQSTQTTQIGVMRAEFVNVLRDMATSDLTFFAAPSERDGNVTLAPASEINGRKQVALEYIYKSGFRITRHFDAETFQLTATDQKMPDGKTQRQLVLATTSVEGILFTQKEAILIDGQKVAEATYEKISVNPTLVPGHFTFPTR